MWHVAASAVYLSHLSACSILSIAALQRGLYTVVATSLIGSILSNLLLVLGEQRLAA